MQFNEMIFAHTQQLLVLFPRSARAHTHKWNFPALHGPRSSRKSRSICVDRGAGEQRRRAAVPCVQCSNGAMRLDNTRGRVLSRVPSLQPSSHGPCPRVLRRFPATSPRSCRPAQRFPEPCVLSSVFHRSPEAGKRGVFR